MWRAALGSLSLLASACGFEHGALQGDSSSSDDAATTAPWLTGFSFRKPITITSPALTAPLAEFPVGILARTDAQLAEHARSDGRDLVFASADGTTRLDHELVRFVDASGALETWVRIPELQGGASTIYLYYGGDTQPSSAITTWPATFRGVWHFDAGVAAADSTPHGHGAFASSEITTPTLVEGIAGGARSFDGVDDAMVIADPSDDSLDFDVGSFSFSLWVYVTSSAGTFDPALYKGGATAADPGYCALLGTANWNMKAHDGTHYIDPMAGMETLGKWVYLAGVVDRGSQRMLAYRDGIAVTTVSTIGLASVSSARSLSFGGSDLEYFHGRIDEVRISAGVASPDWIAAEYANLTSSSFAAIGAQQTAPK